MKRTSQPGTHSALLHKTALAIISLLIAFLFFVLNYYTPLYADDYSYAFSFSTGERIVAVSQIIPSQIAHYHTMNGRIITHTLAQLFLLAGDRVFNVINSLAFLALLYLIYFHACGTFKHVSLSKFSLIGALLFLSSPAFGESYLWIAGASNYLYGPLILLLVLIPYRLQLNRNAPANSRLKEIAAAVIYLPVGIIGGWTIENGSVALIAMLIGYLILYYVRSIRIHAWNITGCIGSIIGCAIMLFSPGTASRLDVSGGSGGIIEWVKRFVLYSCDAVVYLHLVLLVFVVLLTLYLLQRRHLLAKCSLHSISTLLVECGICLVYFLGFLAGVYSMIVTPYFPGRAWSAPLIFFLIVLFNMSTLVDLSAFELKVGKTVFLSFLLLLFAATYVNVYFEHKSVDYDYRERVALVETALANGEKSIALPAICGRTPYTCFGVNGDLSTDSNHWLNAAIARYYEVDEIIYKH